VGSNSVEGSGGGDSKSAKMFQSEVMNVGRTGEKLGLWYEMVRSSVGLVCSSVNQRIYCHVYSSVNQRTYRAYIHWFRLPSSV
jgi:hypothetical protein